MDYTLEDLQKQFQWLRTLRRKISKIKGKDQGNRSLFFLSKRFAYFKKCLYLCAIITKLKSYHYAKKAKRI